MLQGKLQYNLEKQQEAAEALEKKRFRESCRKEAMRCLENATPIW